MATYALDCAFDASATPYDDSNSIAMSYGYAAEDSGSWHGRGQRPEAARTGDQLVFSVFDMADTTSAAIVKVTFVQSRSLGQKQSPLSDSDTQALADGVNLDFASNGASAGCNVRGTGGSLGPYTIKNPGNFEITVVVAVDGKSFSIDPELEVTRGIG